MANEWTFVAACVVGIASAGWLGGCASSRSAAVPTADVLMQPVAVSPEVARGMRVFGADGRVVAWADLVRAASGADVVLIGENHGHELGLASAAALWEDVLERSPRAVLAMEFFERDEQVALDDYVSGVTDERAFIKASGRTSGNYAPGHRAMVERARAARRPVIAANAPRRYVRLARLNGYEPLRELSEEQARLFAIPDSSPTQAYREAFGAIMDRNAGLSEAQKQDGAFMAERVKTLDASFRSQWMWDWTMGESVARAQKFGTPVVLVVGRFHVDHDGGTVQAVRSHAPGVRTVVVSFVDAAVPTEGIGETERARGDFVVFVGPSVEK